MAPSSRSPFTRRVLLSQVEASPGELSTFTDRSRREVATFAEERHGSRRSPFLQVLSSTNGITFWTYFSSKALRSRLWRSSG
uniref:Uncharacterized protein n=1 Tax=Steinernema glaseri TaxID=37863 RepID=A0A1I7XXU6_9BILA